MAKRIAGAISSSRDKRAVSFAGRLEAHDRARHADGEIAVGARPSTDIALVVEIHGLGRGKRRAFAEIEEGRLAVLQPDRHEAAAADIAGGGIDDRQRIADGDGRIDRVAALLQHLDADIGRQMLRGDDHAMLGLHRLRRGRQCGRLERQGKGKCQTERDTRPGAIAHFHLRN